MKKQNNNTTDTLYSFISTIRFIFICILCVSLLFMFVTRKEIVRGTSMYPLLKENQNVFINIIGSYTTETKRFDVVVVKNYRTNDLWVKRVVGLPNEVIAYRNDMLYVNGKRMKEPFLDKAYMKKVKQERELQTFTADYKSKKLGHDEYLLIGDNRVDSFDSRSYEVGPFKREQIIAKGIFIISPFSEMRYVGNGRK